MADSEKTLVQQERHGAVLVLTIDNPPVNPIGVGVPSGILAGLTAAQDDPEIAAVVLKGAGSGIIAGADIRSFGRPWPADQLKLWDLIPQIEASPKPVVAALQNHCLGGGLELAMACHYRVIAPDCKIGQPEVKLGIPPGAGATQRLPRLAGAEKALTMILEGEPIDARDAAEHGIVDRVIEGDFLAGALAFAAQCGASGEAPPRARDKTVTLADPGLFDKTRQKIARRAKGQRAPFACIDCVEASVTKSFDEAIAYERATFEACRDSAEGAALRHVFFAERAVNKVPGLSRETPTQKIETAAVIGAGTMGGGISMSLANAGIPVTVIEREQAALDSGFARIRANYAASVKRGRLSEAELEAILARLTPALGFEAAGDADIVIEAVFEEMPVKQEVFRALDGICKADAILASNTSYLNVDKIAEAAPGHAGRVLGTHFFSPANIMRLLEVVRTEKVAPDILATVLKLGRRIGKLPVVAGVCHGFIGNRMLEGYQREAHFLIEEGALPQQVDAVLTDYGMAMGLFAVSDLAGNDIGWAKRKANAHLREPGKRYAVVADKLCELGRFGQKTGAGFYRYEPGNRTPVPDPEVEAVILAASAELGIERREIGSDEILQRCLYPLVNEGARILEEGIALRASDIDLVWLNGYAFPRWRGGPMHWAEAEGLDKVLAAIKGFQAKHDFWEPAPLLERLVAEGKGFSDHDREGS